MKPICVHCRRFFRMKESGVAFVEAMPAGPSRPPAGGKHDDKWQPYKLWYGDLWACPDCGAQIISGVGLLPISGRHYSGFEADIKAHNAALQINDW